jgi:hypothetical protein
VCWSCLIEIVVISELFARSSTDPRLTTVAQTSYHNRNKMSELSVEWVPGCKEKTRTTFRLAAVTVIYFLQVTGDQRHRRHDCWHFRVVVTNDCFRIQADPHRTARHLHGRHSDQSGSIYLCFKSIKNGCPECRGLGASFILFPHPSSNKKLMCPIVQCFINHRKSNT